MRSYNYMTRSQVREYLPLITQKNVSKVSRNRGFTKIYLEGLDPKKTMASKNQTWHQKRHNFLKRQLASDNDLYTSDKQLSRYHLALIAWAYSPISKIRNNT